MSHPLNKKRTPTQSTFYSFIKVHLVGVPFCFSHLFYNNIPITKTIIASVFKFSLENTFLYNSSIFAICSSDCSSLSINSIV